MLPMLLYVQEPIPIDDYFRRPAKPSKEHYAIYVGDCMTLGRDIISYDKYCKRLMEKQQEEIDRLKKCDFKITKIAVDNLDNLKEYIAKFDRPPIYRIVGLDKIKEKYGI